MIPVVPHKAVAEVSKIGRKAKVSCCDAWMAGANPVMNRKVVGIVLLKWLQWLQWSPHPQLLDAARCCAVA